MAELTKLEVEKAVCSAFRSQFPNLKFQTNLNLIRLDPEGMFGFNPIPDDRFHGGGAYQMDGWATIFAKAGEDFQKAYQCIFNVELIIEVIDGSISVSFKQPISLRVK